MFESVRGLAGGLQGGENWRVSIVAPENGFSDDDRLGWDGFDLRLARGASSHLRPKAAAALGRLIDAGVDIVHIHGVWGVGGLAVLRELFLRGDAPPRLVVSPHGMLDPWAMAQSRVKKTIARRLWVDRLLRRAGCLHALCEAEAMSIAAIAPASPVCVVPNGVQLPSFGESATERQANVLFLGRLHPKKGLGPLLEGWAVSSARHAGWRLDIAGWDDGGYEPELKATSASLGLEQSVRFLGPVFGERKEALLRQAGVFALPSFSEGLPMAVLEAWSYGTPVLMTDGCNLPEGFAAGAAYRCGPEPQSIAAGLDALTIGVDIDRRAMGSRGRALVEQRFGWSLVAGRMSAVYDWLLGGSMPDIVRNTDKR